MNAATLLLAGGLITCFILPASAETLETLDQKIAASVQKVQGSLSNLRTTPTDLLNPPRWEIPHALPHVEKLLQDPARAPVETGNLNASLSKDHSPRALAAFMKKILAKQDFQEPAIGSARYPELNQLPAEIKGPVSKILDAIEKAALLVAQSHENLTAEEKEKILGLYDIVLTGKRPQSLKLPRLRKEIYSSLARFDQDSMVRAAGIVLETVHEQLPLLQSYAASEPARDPDFLPMRFKTAVGNVLIFGKADRSIDLSELDSAAVYIKLGGHNRYEGAPSVPPPGRVRAAFDFGENITILSTGATAGAGVFGIDLFYIPNSKGEKNITTGSYSQGFGLCGVGGLFVNGKGTYQARRYSQGVGIFGAGFFINDDGADSKYQTQLYGQGVGFTRGVGAFIHRGDRAQALAGLVDPDPRESLGATSLSQGVGYGPRAYAGGGLGICLLDGDGIRVESSYFAQGAGYWHGAGNFLLTGNSCTVKARRYDQGSGVHSAFGMFTLSGNDNAVLNWGVGPAFGWDASVGCAFLLGDRNKYQSEWGSGSASLGASRSFTIIQGNHNRIDLPGLGSGQFIRDVSDISIGLIQGAGNRLKSNQVTGQHVFSGPLFVSPWGLVSGDSTTIVSDLGFEKESWRRLPATDLPSESQIDLEKILGAAESLSAKERIEQFAQVAAAFSTDKIQPRRALAKLIAISPEELPYLLDVVDFADVDGFIQVRVAAALWGDILFRQAARAGKKEADPQKKAMILSLLALSKSGTTAPVLIQALSDPDWRVQSTSVRVLGALLNSRPSNISGRVYVLKILEKYLASGKEEKQKEKFLQELGAQPYAEAVGILSAAKNWTDVERAALLEAAPEDITSGMKPDQMDKILTVLERMGDKPLENIKAELMDSQKLARLAQGSFISLLNGIKRKGRESKFDPSIEALTYDLIIALGKVGNGEAVRSIEPYLDDPSAKIREGAAVSLARIGGGSKKALLRKFSSWDPEQRMNVLAAVTETSDKSLLGLIEKGFRDEDPSVRQLALAAVEKLQRPLEGEKENLKGKIREQISAHPKDALQTQRVFLFGEP